MPLGFAAPRPLPVRPGKHARPAQLHRSSPTAAPAPPLPALCPGSSLAASHAAAVAPRPRPALCPGSSLAADQAAAVAPRPRLDRRRCSQPGVVPARRTRAAGPASPLLAHDRSGAAAACPAPWLIARGGQAAVVAPRPRSALRPDSSLAAGQAAAVAPRPRSALRPDSSLAAGQAAAVAPRPWPVRSGGARGRPSFAAPRPRPVRRTH
ncbi:hypothetical protein GQ55_1G188900 [Panicum hallii var. hallii]|uniref:Uncharacterized protein n=1 Tax=Panicum hallii var. hallii TaxID=1504633 RepID=A0A2T7F674_9POAL|nr:hypothetical protein GQ55_1G188900 [Panicum hallii var. hallii]